MNEMKFFILHWLKITQIKTWYKLKEAWYKRTSLYKPIKTTLIINKIIKNSLKKNHKILKIITCFII